MVKPSEVSVFGKGAPEIKARLGKSVVPDEAHSAFALKYIKIATDALDKHIGTKPLPEKYEPNKGKESIAGFTLLLQGMRLIYIEKILAANGVSRPSSMSSWLTRAKNSKLIKSYLH